MIILSIRTDNPEAKLGIYKDGLEAGCVKWKAHRELAETLHLKISELLISCKLDLNNIEGIIVYAGPGSFTGLRIGLSVANALAHSFNIPIVATSDDWVQSGIEKLNNGQSDKIALPDYGSLAHTTTPKK